MSDTTTDLTYGYSVTAEFCGYPNPRAVVRQYGKFISSHETRAEAFAAIEELSGARPLMYRGNYKLPYGSQQQGRDLGHRTITEHYGETAHGYRVDPNNRLPNSNERYEFLLYMPGNYATNWTAFENRQVFEAWMEAYGIEMATDFEDVPADFPVQPVESANDAEEPVTCRTCRRTWDDSVSTAWTPAPSARCPFEYFHDRTWPEPGESFEVRLPDHDGAMLPLTQRAEEEAP